MRVVAKCLIALAVLAGLAAALNVYLNPYSLHVFVYADHTGFDAPPGPDGMVRVGGQRLDFRAPQLSFRRDQIALIRRETQLPQPASDFERAVAAVNFIRQRMNTRDPSLPATVPCTGSALLDGGQECLSLCGEHARLFWEVMQVWGVQARMLWMEGHITAEYFDRQQRSWVFMDPHLGVCLRDETGRCLSAAQATRRLEREQPVEVSVFTEEGDQAATWRALQQEKPAFYRNILLNGELQTCPGSVLVESGRWTHLLQHGRRPQMLVLRTEFDTSAGRYLHPVSWRAIGVTTIALWLCFGSLLLVTGRRPRHEQDGFALPAASR